MPAEPAEGVEYACAWLAKAQGDLHAARTLLSDPDAPRWAVGFHLQQCAEKSLKALVALRGVAPPRTHHLDELCEILAAADACFDEWNERLLPLEVFSVAERYPGEMPEAVVDWQAMLAAVANLTAFVRAQVEPAAPSEPHE